MSTQNGINDDKESDTWSDWFYRHRKQLIIGTVITSVCIGSCYYIWRKQKNTVNYGTYHDKRTNEHLPINDKIEGSSFEFVNNWFCVSSDVSANKCNDKVYFNGMISNESTQIEHESLPPGTMFIMPEN